MDEYGGFPVTIFFSIAIIDLNVVSFNLFEMSKLGTEVGKKVRLQFDISGKADQTQLFALLDAVPSDDEDEIDNLMADSTTEFQCASVNAKEELDLEANDTGPDVPGLRVLDAVIHPVPLPLPLPAESEDSEKAPIRIRNCRRKITEIKTPMETTEQETPTGSGSSTKRLKRLANLKTGETPKTLPPKNGEVLETKSDVRKKLKRNRETETIGAHSLTWKKVKLKVGE